MRQETRPFSTLLAPLLAVTIVVAAAGCTEASEDTSSNESGQASLSLTGSMEDGADPVVGQNALLIDVRDADGQPVEGAVVTVDPQMPMMGHGSSEEAEVVDLGDGMYRAFPVTFTMEGYWEVTVRAVSGDASGELMLPFDV